MSPCPLTLGATVYRREIDSPVGMIAMTATDDALLTLGWGYCSPEGAERNRDANQARGAELNRSTDQTRDEGNSILDLVETQLREYFAGGRRSFDIPLAPRGTEFQRSVWRELSKIPYGEVITYGEQAQRLGRPKSVRAVGAANGKNPIGIVVPCHRVLGASGGLTGFAGGLEAKRLLLELEGIQIDSSKVK